MRSRKPRVVVPRQGLAFLRLSLPSLPARRLAEVVRLQLVPFMPPGPFAFVCLREASGTVAAWAWSAAGEGWPAQAQPEPLFEASAEGFRLLRRSPGFEAQHWQGGELLHTRWFESMPDQAAWATFARSSGADPEHHPCPQAVVAPEADVARGWIAGNNLPPADPWRGWRWQAAVLVAGIAVAFALGVDVATRQRLSADRAELARLRSDREAAVRARTRYDELDAEVQSLSLLVPRVSQLDLLSRVVASGIFGSPPAPPDPAASSPSDAAPPPTRLLEWDYRNRKLTMTLELVGPDTTMLDVTRRLERVPGLSGFKVGQDASGNQLTLSATVDEGPAVTTTPAAGG